jgi:hypothetical protein
MVPSIMKGAVNSSKGGAQLRPEGVRMTQFAHSTLDSPATGAMLGAEPPTADHQFDRFGRTEPYHVQRGVDTGSLDLSIDPLVHLLLVMGGNANIAPMKVNTPHPIYCFHILRIVLVREQSPDVVQNGGPERH